MNPQVVCSVAGLCNNERVQRLAADNPDDTQVTTTSPARLNCDGCKKVVNILENRFDEMSVEEVLQSFLSVSYLFIYYY